MALPPSQSNTRPVTSDTPARGQSNKIQKVVEDLRRRVLAKEWAPEQMLPAQRALSREYDVSQATIAIAMRTLQAEGAIHSTPGIGAFPAESFNPDDTRPSVLPTIGLRGSYVNTSDKSGIPQKRYIGGVLNSIWQRANEINCPLLLMPGNNRLTRQYCQSQGVEGIIFLGGQSYQEAMSLRQSGFPVIIANEPTGFTSINFINHDHANSLTEAVNAFIDHGHERIAVMLPSTTMPDSFQKLKPLFINTLYSRDIHYNVNPYWTYVQRDASVVDDLRGAEQALEALLDLPEPPTAILFFTETFLQYALKVFARRNLRVPEDISIICSPYNPYFYPDISGFEIQYDKMASQLIEGIHKTIENPFYHLQQLIPAKYIDRGTVAAPPQNR